MLKATDTPRRLALIKRCGRGNLTIFVCRYLPNFASQPRRRLLIDTMSAIVFEVFAAPSETS